MLLQQTPLINDKKNSPRHDQQEYSKMMDTRNNDDSREHALRIEQNRPKPLNIKATRQQRYHDVLNDTVETKSPAKKKQTFQEIQSSPLKRKRTIASIVGTGIRQKIEDQIEDQEQEKEYVPTMKEKFLKSQQVILAFEPDQNDGYSAWERIIDVCFGLDIAFNMRTSYINEKTGFEIAGNRPVALNYIKSGRFFVDLAASIPFELVIEGTDPGASNKQLKLFGLLKLVRLLRLGRIIRYMKLKQGFKMGMRLIQLLLGQLLLVHWIACIWYLIIRQYGDWIPPKDIALSNPGDDTSELTAFYYLQMMSQYFVVYYYAVLTMAGAILSAFIFGNMAAIMAAINKKANQFDEQMDLVNTTMRQMKLSPKMQDKVLSFMMHIQYSPDLHQDIDKFFMILNEPLKKQILYHLHGPLIKKVPIMNKSSSVEQSFFISNLKPVLFLPGDYIAREGEKGDNIYFINKGEVQVQLNKEIQATKNLDQEAQNEKNSQEQESDIDEEEKFLATYRILKEGQFFGEVALLTKLKRTASLKSSEFTNCAYMNKDDLKTMEHYYPHIVQQFKDKIREYSDPKMHFRRLMIKNLHFLRNMSDEIVNEIICCLEVKRFSAGSDIIKIGDVSNGSAFCAYTFISDEAQQLQTFRADSDCILESISREDIFRLAKKYYLLADQLDVIREKFDENEIDFDFFRYRPPRKEYSDQLKSLLRKKFRVALCRFYQRLRDGLQPIPEALTIIKEVQAKRAQKIEEINKLRTQSLGINYGGGYGEMHKFHFSQMSGSIVNGMRNESINNKQNDQLKQQSQLLTQSVLIAQENLKKQNIQLLDMIDGFNDKYGILKDKLAQLENDLVAEDIDQQLAQIVQQKTDESPLVYENKISQ
ncbi:cyclic nucleotide-binding protein [Stylonychia lemnae]|uniref:Cyclic nucleotide-binding protein n=1 Tax=Stylonychia lemnae TaxID=5949 RepID=A0A078APT0_STYLE|nr:cyclic nucleotide-binding protein [Stylonychia lemnae]|eukprot:CDW82933.1 cyclic nucleotide-binding protein [Stylonychia lemnae]